MVRLSGTPELAKSLATSSVYELAFMYIMCSTKWTLSTLKRPCSGVRKCVYSLIDAEHANNKPNDLFGEVYTRVVLETGLPFDVYSTRLVWSVSCCHPMYPRDGRTLLKSKKKKQQSRSAEFESWDVLQ